jgi:VanZ family protein
MGQRVVMTVDRNESSPTPTGWLSPRWMRPAFVLYLLALVTATHWPRLTIGPEIPVNDKEIHFAAYAAFTALLWFTRWVRPLWLVMVIALAWAGLDESSQAIPAIHRTACWPDYFANAAGIVTMTIALWIWERIGKRY